MSQLSQNDTVMTIASRLYSAKRDGIVDLWTLAERVYGALAENGLLVPEATSGEPAFRLPEAK